MDTTDTMKLNKSSDLGIFYGNTAFRSDEDIELTNTFNTKQTMPKIIYQSVRLWTLPSYDSRRFKLYVPHCPPTYIK